MELIENRKEKVGKIIEWKPAVSFSFLDILIRYCITDLPKIHLMLQYYVLNEKNFSQDLNHFQHLLTPLVMNKWALIGKATVSLLWLKKASFIYLNGCIFLYAIKFPWINYYRNSICAVVSVDRLTLWHFINCVYSTHRWCIHYVVFVVFRLSLNVIQI